VIELTQTSYLVLGLISIAGEATPYALKQMVAASVGNFWSIPHSQLYAEPDRLAKGGYLTVEQERGGRRRKHYSLTRQGKEALERWKRAPTDGDWELRDPGILKLFFGADTAALAAEQLTIHKERLAEYEAMRAQIDEPVPAGARLALEAGIGHAREYIRFWSKLAAGAKE
jgi:PadR family transcriptional regulator AphA